MDQIDPKLWNELQEKFSSKLWRLENLYFIKDKNGKKIRFKLNHEQRTYFGLAHNRNINLKARQLGFTTLACIDSLDDVLFNSYFDAGIIADDIDNAKAIFFNKVKFAYENLPEAIRKALPARNDREGELRFDHGSSISVDTSFRGGTLRRLHISEFGKISIKFPKKAEEIVTGAFEAVPIDGRIDIESTAEGMTGRFYDMCMEAIKKKDAKDKLTSLDFKFHFNPWFNSEEYRLNPEGVTIPHKLAGYFNMLEDSHGIKLDSSQKAWYAKKAEQQKEFIKREYPSYPEEAFLNSGRPVFDTEQVSAAIARAEKLEYIRCDISKDRIHPSEHGQYKIYKTKQLGRKYAIGADVAEGLETGDYSTMTVVNKDLEQVMSYHGHIHPDLFGAELIKAGYLYDTALIAPEVNNHGLTTLTRLTNSNYPNIYTREALEQYGTDWTSKVGWHTNAKTKPMMLDEFIAMFRDGLCTINDVETLREMLTLTYNPDGSVNLNGKDRVVSFCIALQAIKQVHEVNLGAFETSRSNTRKVYETKFDVQQYHRVVDTEESYFD
jgi:hypothetical protein